MNEGMSSMNLKGLKPGCTPSKGNRGYSIANFFFKSFPSIAPYPNLKLYNLKPNMFFLPSFSMMAKDDKGKGEGMILKRKKNRNKAHHRKIIKMNSISVRDLYVVIEM